MKTKILTIIITIFAGITGNAQSILYTVLVGDSVELSVSGANGTIQWQESEDSLVWSDIAGATGNPQSVIATSSVTGKRFFRAEITNVSICENAPWYSNIIRHELINATTEVQLGDWFRGGIVFYVDGVGNGLITPEQYQSMGAEWGCYGTSISGAISLTDGAANTSAILAACSTRPIAASICDDLVENGYNDWFLPSKDQLDYLYLQKILLGNYFSDDSCFSSTEYNDIEAWSECMGTGEQFSCEKSHSTYRLKCVRSFSPTDYLEHVNSDIDIVNQPVTVSISANPQSQISCNSSDVTFSVTATGTTPYSYQWMKDGLDVSGATNSSLTIDPLSLADEGEYYCEVTNLCKTIPSDTAELRVVDITVDGGLDAFICNGQNTSLASSGSSNYAAESGTLSYSWTPTTGLSTPGQSSTDADPVLTTDYTVQVTDQLGCIGTDIVNVFVQNPYEDQEICLVTVDTSLWKNKVVWEKVSGVGTSNIFIYKEVALNVYNWLGTVPYDSPGYFIDDSSVPESHGDKYKISVVDTCLAESAKSYYHMTMNLVISTFGSTMGLSWTPYVDESGNYTPANYYIYKGTQPNNMVLLDSISSSFTSYNDNNVFDIYYYMVGVKKDGGCSDGSKSTYQNSFSNKKQNSLGINDFESDNSIRIFPNPFIDKTTLSLVNKNIRNYNLTISDVTGKVVRKDININKSEFVIERGDFKAGVYFLELKSDKIFRGKLIVK
ncbi:MAG: immunoglobulin domain-containing protein [Bacteroidota bacterium]